VRRTLADLAAIVAEGVVSLILADSFGIDEPAAATRRLQRSPAPGRHPGDGCRPPP